MITRRELLIGSSVSLLAAPLCSFSQQQGKVWRVGFMSAQRGGPNLAVFVRRMRELGYIENKNLVFEWRFADGQPERLPGLATELVQAKVDVILTTGTLATTAAQKVTTTIPIVMANVADPVGSGFVKSLARPGTNITGLSNVGVDLGSKHLEMLLGVLPKLTRVAVLLNPANPAESRTLKNLLTAAQKPKIDILNAEARNAREIDNAFLMMAQEGAGAVIVSLDSLFNVQQRRIAELSARYRLPSISGRAEYAESGFLMSYGPSTADIYRRAAAYVDKILKGARPAELPVELPNTFELVINRKTANALGLTIPQSLLISADKVIE